MIKTAIVTGATGAIGKAIARGIAAQSDFEVILPVRNKSRGERAVKEIIKATGNENVRMEICDLSRRREIFDFAGQWDGPLHLLINNAATAPRSREETPEGIEVQWAANVLGYFWMIRAFEEALREGNPSRVVNVASYWAGGLDLTDPEFTHRRYNNDAAYRQSKQADRMLSVAFAERLYQAGITVNSCHPGDVNSTLSNDLGFGGHDSPDEGALTPVWLATDESLEGVTGKYFEHCRESRCQFSADSTAVDALWEACLIYE
jgi:NAD(P)-dependent dehydrogenase (short-subunit alcohol dehydrogenase family)